MGALLISELAIVSHWDDHEIRPALVHQSPTSMFFKKRKVIEKWRTWRSRVARTANLYVKLYNEVNEGVTEGFETQDKGPPRVEVSDLLPVCQEEGVLEQMEWNL